MILGCVSGRRNGQGRWESDVVGSCAEIGVQRFALKEERVFSELRGGLTPQRRPRARNRFIQLEGEASLSE